MLSMLWPMAIVVISNTIYNICAKSTPQNINGFASLSITYLIAAVTSVIMFFVTAPEKHLIAELTKTNWTAWVLGIAIVGLEFGYFCIYRAGWKVSIASLVANIALACILIIVGILFYKEALNLRQVIGIIVCGIGLFLVAK